MKFISLIVLAAEPAKASTASPKSAGTQQSQIAVKFDYDGGEREFAYDRKSHVGRLGRGLNEAGARGWTVVSMKDDWKTIVAPALECRAFATLFQLAGIRRSQITVLNSLGNTSRIGLTIRCSA